MADTPGQERTEAATPRRLSEAAERGQIPYSKEITEAILFLTVILAMALFGKDLVHATGELVRRHLSFDRLEMVAPEGILGFLRGEVFHLGELLLPVFGLVMAVLVLVGGGQAGFRLATKKLEPKPDKLDPIKGFKKLFSLRSLVMVLLQAAKVTIVGIVGFIVVTGLWPVARNLAQTDPLALLWLFPDAILEIGITVGVLLLLLAIGDVLFQRWKHAQELKMTKQEVKEDHRNTEGDPQIKARIRQLQRERARQRMLGDVRKATVVVRNPTHYAVALRYEAGKDAAPIVVAKGKNWLALRIIEIAEEAKVPIRTDPPLARRMYGLVKIGQIVPEELFRAVAQVLAWVYRRQGRDRLPTAVPKARPKIATTTEDER